MQSATILAALLGFVAGQDTGFELLYKTNTVEVSNKCVTVANEFPTEGDYIVASTGEFEFQGKDFQGVLDAFGKMHRFELRGNQVCATYSMLRGNFYNASQQAGDVSHGILFYETNPPRPKCPLLKPMCNEKTLNDNCYVNTFFTGGELYTLTDSLMMVKIDPATLAVKESISYDTMKGMTIPLSTAHPLWHPKTNKIISYREQMNLTTMEHEVIMYTIDGKPEVAANRKDIAAPATVGKAPYMHSYGLSMNYAVLPRMPVAIELDNLATISQMFTDLELKSDRDPNNAFHIVPLNGSAPFIRYLPMSKKLYFVHTANTYENETGIVIDLTTSDSNAFKGMGNNISAMRSKATRDAPERNPVTRFLLPFDESVPVSWEILTDQSMTTDFTVINNAYSGQKYCYFWANSWYTGSKAYGDMGIVKYNLCDPSQRQVAKVWSRDNWFPSEPKMIPKAGGAEDEGMLVFTALNGESGETFLITADASTLETTTEAGPFPRIGFTGHGEWYAKGTFSGL